MHCSASAAVTPVAVYGAPASPLMGHSQAAETVENPPPPQYREVMSTQEGDDIDSAVDQYFATNPDIFDVDLTEDNTVPRRPR